MNEKKRYLVKNTSILAVSNFATKILSVFLIPLYTGILTTSDYGIYDLVSSAIGILFSVFTLNISDAAMLFLMEKKDEKNDIGKIGVKYVIGSATVVWLLLMSIWIFKLIPEIQNYIFIIALQYLTSGMHSFMVQFAKGCEKVKDIAIGGVLTSVCVIFFNILFLVFLRLGLLGFFLASLISETVACLYFAVRLELPACAFSGKKNRMLEKDMLIYSTPLIAITISWWANGALDKIVVTYICGVAANGLLSIAYKLPNIMNMLQSIFIQAWQISAIKEYGKKDTSNFYGSTFIVINTMLCAACAWLIFIARPVARLLFANDFYNAWQYVPFLLISSVINSASGMLGPILSAGRESKALMWSALSGLITNVIMNIVLVRIMGIQGATIATVISSWVIYIVRKIAVGNKINISGYWIIIATWCMLCIQALVEIYIGKYWIEIIIMGILLVINFSGIKKIVTLFLEIIMGILKKFKR